MNLSINSIVIRLINNKSIEIMNVTDIKKVLGHFLQNPTITSIWEEVGSMKL